MAKKHEWHLAAFAAFLCAALIAVSGAQAQGSGTPTGGTSCFVNGQWVFYPSGGCPASGGRSGNRSNDPAAREETRAYSRYAAALNRALKLYKQGVAQDAARGLASCQGALSSIDEALQYEPGDGDALAQRRQITGCISSCNGQLAVQRGDFDQGIAYFREAESEYPESNALGSRALPGQSRSGSRRLPDSERLLPMRKRRPMLTGNARSRRK